MVEEALLLHPDIAETAVCGVPHRHHGEIVKAFVVLKPENKLSSKVLREFLKDKLAPFEMPRQVAFVESLPKSMIGKPLRRVLVAEELKRQRREEQEAAEKKQLEAEQQ